VIVVFPNGYVSSMWANSANSNKPAETNIVRELIPHVDSTYRTIANRQHRIVQGYSMGGFGAAKFIAKYPELFSKAYVIDGALHTWATFLSAHSNLAQEIFDNSDSLFAVYAPWLHLSRSYPLLRDSIALYVGVGTLTAYNRSFRDTLQRYAVPFEYVETGCSHNLRCVTDSTAMRAIRYLLARSSLTTVHVRHDNSATFMLHDVYPNPFNSSVTIRFSLPQREHVTLKLFDALGREVATILDAEKTVEEHRLIFNASNLPSGVYFYRLQSGDFVKTKKLLLLSGSS
jgi:hypothetical protein